MKIADALLLQQDMAAEISRLKELASTSAWEYRSQRGVGEKLEPNFDLDENHARVRALMKLKRSLSRAISRANNTVDLEGINDQLYSDWL